MGRETEEKQGPASRSMTKPGDTRIVYLQDYTCHDCGHRFIVRQSSPGADEDITLCWECIDLLFGGTPKEKEEH
jgi:transposase-like protein